MEVFFVPSHQTLGSSPERVAFAWLREHLDEGTPVLLVPSHQQATANPDITALDSAIGHEIPRNFPPRGWAGGPVIAPWPDKEVFDVLDRSRQRISSLCVIKWLAVDTEIDAWLTARNAIDVTGDGRRLEPADITDPVVRVVMEHLTRHINLGNRLAQQIDRTDTIRRLQYVVKNGHALDAEELYTWALANGWGRVGAERLQDIAERIMAGRSFRKLA